jgi:hypothetical protein
VDILRRYHSEPSLRACVETMVSILATGEIDPRDLSNAVHLATRLYAERSAASGRGRARPLDFGHSVTPARLFEQACEAAERACIDGSEASLEQLQREIDARLVQLRAGRLGAPGVRDPNAPCENYDPSDKQGALANCETDGHYLCEGCCHRREGADGDGRYSVPPKNRRG